MNTQSSLLNKRRAPLLKGLALLLTLCCFAVQASAKTGPLKRTLCVYDPGGASGDFFNLMQKSYQVDVLGLKQTGDPEQVQFELIPQTDEQTVFDDFKAKKCHAMVVTGTRARALLPVTGSLEAMGALPDYALLKQAIGILSSPKASKLMKRGEYQAVGVVPGGAVYLYVRDREMNNVKKLAGKKIATLSFDQAAKTMVDKIGASMISAEISTFAGMFNNNTVDACYAPAFAYEALELKKGLAKGGGVIRYPLAQVTFQIIIRSEDFPEYFPNASRKVVAGYAKKAIKTAQRAEKKIKDWVEIPKADQESYDEMFRKVRIELRDQKIYSKYALKLMRRIRCKNDKTRPECVGKAEE